MARDSGKPLVSEFDLYILAKKLFAERQYNGRSVPHRNGALTAKRARKLISDSVENDTGLGYGHFGLDENSRLQRDTDFSTPLYKICDVDTIGALMAADPFCYLSYLSAMEWHCLCEPKFQQIHITTPQRPEWNRKAYSFMLEMLDYNSISNLPFRLTRPQPMPEVRGNRVYQHETRHPIDFATSDSNRIRVTSIGQTFCDMLGNAALCGGMANVISIWRAKALDHLEEIIEGIEATKEKIVKVRAGYLLEEVLGVIDPRINIWVNAAQRGSSRKLDPTEPYVGKFSAKWMLSINVSDADLPSTSAH